MTRPSTLPAFFLERPFAVRGDQDFNALAMDLFHLHAERNPVYHAYLQALRRDAEAIRTAEDIPFLPIGLFRTHRVLLEGLEADLRFASSGTTGTVTSTHHVPFPEVYERSFRTSFEAVYGPVEGYRVLALLPAYLERPDSSLVYMAERLIQASGDPESGTWLHDLDGLAELLQRPASGGRRTLLLGVTFALLDLAEHHPMPLHDTLVMETGGMKGRRPEMVRAEVHTLLKEAFQVDAVHSEYGMTELLSQAWSTGAGVFQCPPWMRVLLREPNDPFARLGPGRTGGIDIIDLCNAASCPFVSTQDLGRLLPDGRFEVLGRFDHSDLRGCNLMVA